MMKLRGLILGFTALVFGVSSLPALAVSMADLQNQAQQMKAREARIWAAREAEQTEELRKQERLANEATARRNKAEARSNALDAQWQQNDARIKEMQELLHQHQGNLGELFGVTRQVAGDASSVFTQSLINTQLGSVEGNESRINFMRRIADAKALPAFTELERMWYELHREMTETGKVIKYSTPVVLPDDSVEERDVVRIGPFVAMSGNQFLEYSSTEQTLRVMPSQLGGADRAMTRKFVAATGADSYQQAVVDPSRGALLDLVSTRPTLVDRIIRGEVVGYLIVAVGLLGFCLALYQYGYLFLVRRRVNEQLHDQPEPKATNPIGRLRLAFRSDVKETDDPEVVELRLSEAVLREIPPLQRFQAFLKLVVAAGPLLGLVGTVIGMIITFHAITASGSSDPRLMANGIGQAMIATVLGLGIAIPLLFMNTGLAALSNRLTQALDEEAQSLLASRLESTPTAP
ncbi:MAG: MotA/TolQ/ExbB proton channel family protein [Porticoccaceae bacterium]